MAEDSTPTTDSTHRDQVLRETYTEATKQLRERHLKEFNDLRQSLAKKQGVDWTPPLTEKEKAAKELTALLTEHPDLIDEVTSLVAGKEG